MVCSPFALRSWDSAPANVSAGITRAVFMLRWHAGFVLCENDCGLSAPPRRFPSLDVPIALQNM
jgi:hypothetical protein